MLHNLHLDSRLRLCGHIQSQALLASDIRARRLAPENFRTDHFCLVVRDVHVGLCVDELESAHFSPNTLMIILAC